MPTPAYIKTRAQKAAIKRHLETYVGNLFDAVVPFQRNPQDAIAARFGSDVQLRRGLCLFRFVQRAALGSLSSAGTLINSVVQMEVTIAVPTNRSIHNDQMDRLDDLTDQFAYEVFHPTNVQAVSPAFYDTVVKVEFVGNREEDLGSDGLLAATITYNLIPAR